MSIAETFSAAEMSYRTGRIAHDVAQSRSSRPSRRTRRIRGLFHPRPRFVLPVAGVRA